MATLSSRSSTQGKNNDGANEGRDAIQPAVYHVSKVFIALTARIHLELIQVYWHRFCADTRIFADVAFRRLRFFHGKKGSFASDCMDRLAAGRCDARLRPVAPSQHTFSLSLIDEPAAAGRCGISWCSFWKDFSRGSLHVRCKH
ncbi:hypothetical protein H8A99_19715 [Bradyrhizobium sp. Arg68]|uniref:hypothetical protein n=1 Tax=Bradyrhizobium ivorense TaxID=2511166 RepID=UPI001E586CB1|nr:hypothetical protein [Bradyrhizobium ivorense]MCC8938642.1 hypothetical protein [Bradyrhizobium ivorense]